MKYTIVLLLFGCSFFVSAQKKTFTLHDTDLTHWHYITRQILFDSAKIALRPESSILLDSVVTFMNNNKSLIIEVGVHENNKIQTIVFGNSIGVFSQRRAESIVNYLMAKGIKGTRLVAYGYGAEKQIKIGQPKEEFEQNLKTDNRYLELRILSFGER